MSLWLFVVLLIIASFNYNFHLLRRDYFKKVTRYRLLEWICFGWMGRVAVTAILSFIYNWVSNVFEDVTYEKSLPLIIFIAVANAFWTWHEIWRDERRARNQSAYIESI